MATTRLPRDFKELLKLLNARDVEYLRIGGYAVGYYGYPRATADMDLWIADNPENADKLVGVIRTFGFDVPNLSAELFLINDQIASFGAPLLRIEIMTSVSGIQFHNCYVQRTIDVIDGVQVSLISIEHLKANKQSAGRHKDLDDLEHLA